MSTLQLRIDATRDWLQHVASDLVTGEGLLTLCRWADAAFYAQQAAERSAKAFLTWHDEPFPKTHNLRELAQLIESKDAGLMQIVLGANVLTPYAWEFRYPGAKIEATEELAKRALQTAHTVYEAVLTRVPTEAHPTHGDHQ
jgi:HEPN domain-containing protein